MLRFILRRLLQAIPIVLATTFIAYGVIRAAPGDPVQMLVGDPNKIPASYIEDVKAKLGLDKPWYVSYVYWLRNLIYNPAPPPIVDLVLEKELMHSLHRSSVNLKVENDTLLYLGGEQLTQKEFAYAIRERITKKTGSSERKLWIDRTISPMNEILDQDRNTPFHAVFVWQKSPVLTGLFDEKSGNDNELSRLFPRIDVEIVETNPRTREVTVRLRELAEKWDGEIGKEYTIPLDDVNVQLRLNSKRVKLKDFQVGQQYMLTTRDRETSKLFALADQASADKISDMGMYEYKGVPLASASKDTLGLNIFNAPVTVKAVVAKAAKRFDMGESFNSKRPVTELYMEALNNTFFLVLMVLILEFLIAVPVGIIVALKKNSVLDHTLTFLAFVGISLPNFWLALILLMVFAYNLKWLPSGGMQSQGVTFSLSDPASVVDYLKHLIMPLTVMTLGSIAGLVRYTRASVLDVIHQDYVRTAKAKGLSFSRVVFGHVLKNSMIPIITLIGLSLPILIGGSFIVETIFTWPGMGKLGLTAVFERDYPVIMAGILFGSMMIIFGQLAADVMYAWANPRIRKSFEG